MRKDTSQSQHVVIIGGGFGGLGSAILLAKAGYRVTLLEKNEQLGGRASVFEAEGFRFDMGPSWYLMPDVFEEFFTALGEDINDHLHLQRLQPSYRVFFKDTGLDPVDIYSDLSRDEQTFESLEPGSSQALRIYLEKAEYQYEIAKARFLYKNYDRARDFLTKEVATEGRKLSVFQTMDRYVSRYFQTEAVKKLIQYPLVFLGSSPYNTPALYNIMNHIDYAMGVYYPRGGIYAIIEALETIGRQYGVDFRTHQSVSKITTQSGVATGVQLEDGEHIEADIVVSNADIAHTEQSLLDPSDRMYRDRYFRTRTLAPSAFMMYLGVDGQLQDLRHHTLIFSKDWQQNFAEIFDRPALPSDPSVYLSNPSKTDNTVAPDGTENLVVLVPIAAGMELDTDDFTHYGDQVLATIGEEIGAPDLPERIIYRSDFNSNDFAARYHAYGGTALGLAHTLRQTALLRPNNTHKKLRNLYFVGASTNPGIGMPICLISAELLTKRLLGDTSDGPLSESPLWRQLHR